MKYLMEVVKKFEQKEKKDLIRFDYKRMQVNPDSKSTWKEEERNQ